MHARIALVFLALSLAVYADKACGSGTCGDNQSCHTPMGAATVCCDAGTSYCGCPETFRGHICSTGSCYDASSSSCTVNSYPAYVVCPANTQGCVSASGATGCCSEGYTCDTYLRTSYGLCVPNNSTTSSETTNSPAVVPIASSTVESAPAQTSSSSHVHATPLTPSTSASCNCASDMPCCDGACYSPNNYGCYARADGKVQLCYEGTSLCGTTCYDTNSYHCENGVVTQN
ncbi:glyoxal oxidase [Planoprotostelium fungivorum]|uniref:Glyoxal oxidase n=1 Tax=Planoprotostelium fungivorum TaxID=1890364 RepID=A0A2P6NSP7_9EUKA|nr:glyoxal oxidase [Planoprotostelium fungivorum]PRP86987.1 glyoxal oxidase [Planoprotostelium fungivorum]